MASYSLIDTESMPWEENPDIPGYKRRLLHSDTKTGAIVRMGFVAPGSVPKDISLPHRHYHKSVTERAYHLFGDFPHWEFSGKNDREGELIVFRRHLFMDRPPKSIHGLKQHPVSQAGSVILYWNTGSGTGVAEPEAVEETVELPFKTNTRDGTNYSEARIFDSEEIPWQKHPRISTWKIRTLAESTDDIPGVHQVHIPAGWVQETDHASVCGHPLSCWLFVVSGDLQLSATNRQLTDELNLTYGSFLNWQAGINLGLPEKPVSLEGCIVLCVGNNLF